MTIEASLVRFDTNRPVVTRTLRPSLARRLELRARFRARRAGRIASTG